MGSGEPKASRTQSGIISTGLLPTGVAASEGGAGSARVPRMILRNSNTISDASSLPRMESNKRTQLRFRFGGVDGADRMGSRHSFPIQRIHLVRAEWSDVTAICLPESETRVACTHVNSRVSVRGKCLAAGVSPTTRRACEHGLRSWAERCWRAPYTSPSRRDPSRRRRPMGSGQKRRVLPTPVARRAPASSENDGSHAANEQGDGFLKIRHDVEFGRHQCRLSEGRLKSILRPFGGCRRAWAATRD